MVRMERPHLSVCGRALWHDRDLPLAGQHTNAVRKAHHRGLGRVHGFRQSAPEDRLISLATCRSGPTRRISLVTDPGTRHHAVRPQQTRVRAEDE